MKLFTKLTASLLVASSVYAANINVYETTESKAINYKTLNAVLETSNYTVETVSRLDKQFKKKWKDTTFDKFKIIAVRENEITPQLIAKYPDAGAFIPFSIALQSKSDSDKVTFTTLDTDTMKKVLGAKDCKLLDKLESKTNKVASTFGFDVSKPKNFNYEMKKAEGPLLYKKELKGDPTILSNKLINTMIQHKFKVVNGLNLKKEYPSIKKEYDFYKTFSICKVKVMYLAAQTRPEAAAFAPCSLAIYKKKGSDKVTFAFPSTYNWLSTLNFEDPKAIKILRDEQKEIEHFINKLQ